MQRFLRSLVRTIRHLVQDSEPLVYLREPKRPIARLHLERLEERLSPSSLFLGNPSFPHGGPGASGRVAAPVPMSSPLIGSATGGAGGGKSGAFAALAPMSFALIGPAAAASSPHAGLVPGGDQALPAGDGLALAHNAVDSFAGT
jgi:hypothetical protein